MTLRYRKLWLAIGWGLVAMVFWLSLKSPSDGPALINDKLAHFIAYLGMTLWFGQIYRRLGLLAAAMLALGALIEVLQGMTGYRDMSLADLLADALGIALGWSICARLPDILLRVEQRWS